MRTVLDYMGLYWAVHLCGGQRRCIFVPAPSRKKFRDAATRIH